MKPGDTCWIIENGHSITVALILSVNGNFYLLRLDTGKTIRLPRHRLFDSREVAEKK